MYHYHPKRRPPPLPSPHSAKKEQTLRFLGNEANNIFLTLFHPLLFNLKIGLEVIAVVRSRFKYLFLLQSRVFLARQFLPWDLFALVCHGNLAFPLSPFGPGLLVGPGSPRVPMPPLGPCKQSFSSRAQNVFIIVEKTFLICVVTSFWIAGSLAVGQAFPLT